MKLKTDKNKFVRQILVSFEKKKTKNPRYSWRILAKSVGISHSFLFSILQGQRRFPPERLDLLVKALDLDHFSEAVLVDSYLRSLTVDVAKKSKSIQKFLVNFSGPRGSDLELENVVDYSEIPEQKSEIFNYWYIPAILDLVPTMNFNGDPEWIANRLSISTFEAKWGWDTLVRHKMVTKNSDGEWEKVNRKVRVASKRSLSSVRNYYSQMFRRVEFLMQNNKDASAYERRLVMGLTCSVNPANFQKARHKMESQLLETGSELSDGQCTEVYYVMSLAIPLTK